MQLNKRLSTVDIALTASFAALYAVLSFMPLSQIIGVAGRTIAVSAIIAPLIGTILGPYLGFTAAIMGGTLALFLFPIFSPPSFVSGAITAFFSGMLVGGRQKLCTLVYASLLALFAFYPQVGPVWLYPPVLWLQIIGFAVLSSPLQNKAVNEIKSTNSGRLLVSFFLTFLMSTLAGQIAGSLTFEIVYWPSIIPDLDAWTLTWQATAFLYPLERGVIAAIAATASVPLFAVLRAAKLKTFLTAQNPLEKSS